MNLLTLLVKISLSAMLVHSSLNIKVTEILYYWHLLLDSFCFCETYFTTHPQFVANKGAISPFLGGCHCTIIGTIVAYATVR